MGIPLIALATRQPEFRDYNQNQAFAQEIQGMKNQNALAPGQQQLQQQNIKLNTQEIEQRRIAAEQQAAINEAYKNSVKPNAQGQPEIDTDSMSKALAASGHGAAIPGILENITKYQESRGNLMKQQQALQEGSADLLGHAAAAVRDAKYSPQVAHAILDTMGDSPQIQQMRQLIDSNPDQFKQQVDSAIAQSPFQQKLKNATDVATIRASVPKEGELPLQNPDQMNKTLGNRYGVLHPGEQVPPEYQLPPNATQKDYDRINQSLSGTENAIAAKAARDAAAAASAQAEQDRQEKNKESTTQKGITPVVGKDKNGKEVLVPLSDAEKMGLTEVTKADADLYNKSHAARTWLQLAGKQGSADDPSSMGLVQLVDRLDKSGKLGPLAGRWNEFLSGKYGSGDPEYSALRTKMGLSTTKLMQAHVGSRGGAFMMEHFEDLANAKKMDASTLRQGILSEMNYMKDVAMMPDSDNAQAVPAAGALPGFANWKNKK